MVHGHCRCRHLATKLEVPALQQEFLPEVVVQKRIRYEMRSLWLSTWRIEPAQ